jgi:hypothetical protein
MPETSDRPPLKHDDDKQSQRNQRPNDAENPNVHGLVRDSDVVRGGHEKLDAAVEDGSGERLG